ncbi:MAG: homocysteine S-methyltransferase family protein [Clostridia bacterium]|nr:homocysteine S-methyltransferase family protein [Clostridia bacterium]MBQ4609175.1 homocysteine S-methyltransferase family protein [Clostridia bacterium]
MRDNRMEQRITLLDGAMGTMLQRAGLKLGDRPETLSMTAPDVVESIQRRYVQAGTRLLLANTFCANAHKLDGTGYSVDEVISASVSVARKACAGTEARVALDIGPIGELLEPLGTLSFEEAYALFAQMIRAGVKAGADAVFFETFSDLAEIRAGILAAKECCDLPVYASMTFEQSGRTFLGVRADAAAISLSALGVDALGVNCSLGPKEIAPILRDMRAVTDLPLILKPNAGLPDPATGAYNTTPQEFAAACADMTDLGAAYIGGCCGTTPDFIAALHDALEGKAARWEGARLSGVCSAREVCAFGKGVRVIGERINPTGKKRFQQALREDDMNYIVSQAIEQEDAGAQILDINVGLPGIDEPEMMRRVVTAVSGAVSLPLQIDSSNPAAIEAGLRAAPGKCLVNSVNATQASLDSVLPLVRKYGAAVVALTLGENGLPKTSQERFELAQKILAETEKYGIPRGDVAVDCLTLTVSAQQEQAAATLDALRRVRDELGLETVLGVSNISFGLPARTLVTQAFLTQAIACGLTMPIINPNQREMMDAVDACRVLSGEDASCAAYIERHAPSQTNGKREADKKDAADVTISEAISKGMKAEAAAIAGKMLETETPLDLVEKHLIPALDEVGERYEKQQIFLPQLMNAAAASGAAFDEVRRAIEKTGAKGEGKGPILLATVEGDIHDIGKNIVRTVLENYGFHVIDLGRDVPAERVVAAAEKHGAKLIGLSALMTTTVPNMQKTIAALRGSGLSAPVIVGGAVLTAEYARRIGADYYAKDAKQAADIAKAILG